MEFRTPGKAACQASRGLFNTPGIKFLDPFPVPLWRRETARVRCVCVWGGCPEHIWVCARKVHEIAWRARFNRPNSWTPFSPYSGDLSSQLIDAEIMLESM